MKLGVISIDVEVYAGSLDDNGSMIKLKGVGPKIEPCGTPHVRMV